MKRGLFALVVAVLMTLSPAVGQTQGVGIELTVVISVEWQPLGDEIGDECRLWDLVPGSANLYTDLPQQIIITNPLGAIIAAEPIPRDGVWVGNREAEACEGQFTVRVPDFAFYTFTIVDIFAYTESAARLKANDWMFSIAFLEVE